MITDIHLQQFRSYLDESFEFSSSVNIIVGPNTSGKTNLLEALLIVARGNSYRAKDGELVSFNKDWAKLETNTPTGSRVVKIVSENSMVKKSFVINDQPQTRLSNQKKIPIVLFEPDQLLMLIGSPEARRNYIDDLLEQTTLEFSVLRRQYQRALSQRNALLKKSRAMDEGQIFAWNIRLSSLAGKIYSYRIKLIEDMNAFLTDTYKQLSSSKQKATLTYSTNCSQVHYETDLLRKLEASIDNDYQRGYTTHGPHRDDIKMLFGKIDIKEVASRGEIRTLLLALKIIESRLVEEARGVKPLLLLDDVFSELDSARRQSLTKFLQPYQAFITTTDADVVIQHFTETANIIPLQTS